jgi:hypothetical protein
MAREARVPCPHLLYGANCRRRRERATAGRTRGRRDSAERPAGGRHRRTGVCGVRGVRRRVRRCRCRD